LTIANWYFHFQTPNWNFREWPDETSSQNYSQNQLIQEHNQAINNPAPDLQDNKTIDLD